MKNKTKKIIRLLCAVLLIVVLQTMGYTYAKYYGQESGTGHAEVAKWAFQIDKEGAQTKTVQLLNTADTDTLVDGKIAPGTSGQISIKLDATGSDVDVVYEIKFANEENKPNNLYFTYAGKEYESISDIINIKGRIKHDEEKQQREIKISWEWKYETGESLGEIAENDIIDMQDAKSITAYTFDIIATGTQGE